jgi:hypothetical protein
MKRVRAASPWILLGAWLLFAVPFVAVGPNDVEDFYTGVASTKMMVDSMAEGAWPFWNMDSALGVPQPFRFHFVTHPLSPLCHVSDCARVLRVAAALQALLGSVFMALLVRRITADESVSWLAGISFLLSSSVVQPTYVDDWAISAMCGASLPALVYAVDALLRANSGRDSIRWTLVLGGLGGLIFSLSFPFAIAAAIVLFLFAQPKATLRRWRWLVFAAGIAVVIASAHLYQLIEQYRLMPGAIGRENHTEPSLLAYLYSAFIGPVPSRSLVGTWRAVFVGGPFAVAALAGLVRNGNPAVRTFRLALLISIGLLCVPESWLFNVMTNRWGFRAGLNVFAIALGASVIAGLRRGRYPAAARHAIALQALALAVPFSLAWIPMVQASTDARVRERSERVKQEDGITGVLVSLQQAQPGRVAFAPAAYAATRGFRLTREGLAPNQPQMSRVPSLYAETQGIATDELAPMRYAFVGPIAPTPTTVTAAATLNVLGVRYVLAMADDVVSDQLRLIRTIPPGIRIYENPDAWPEAFFVPQFPSTPLPRLPNCGHDRYLCADFDAAGVTRDPQPITIDRLADGMTLRFAPSDTPRNIVVTQWYQPYWHVTAGSARLLPAGEQLIGVQVPAGERRVTIAYRPVFRASLFFAGLCAEAVVVLSIAWLSLPRLLWRTRRRKSAEAPLSPLLH